MRALDYHPDHVARSLKIGSTNVVGMVIPDVTNPFFTELMQGAEQEARRCGMSVMLSNTDGDPADRASPVEHPAGPSGGRDSALLRRFIHALEQPEAAQSFTSGVLRPAGWWDAYQGAQRWRWIIAPQARPEATRYLISLWAIGAQSKAIIAGSQKVSPGIARLEGISGSDGISPHLPVRTQYVSYGDFSIDSGYRSALELIALPSPPTAIFSCNNKMTLGLMRAMAERRVPCPEDISVIGFDDFEWSANFSPRLTTMGQPTRAMGRKAMEMLLDQINKTEDYVSPGTVTCFAVS